MQTVEVIPDHEVKRETCTCVVVFVPITVGGGIRSVSDAEQALKAGADKVAINTAAVRNSRLVTDIANRFAYPRRLRRVA